MGWRKKTNWGWNPDLSKLKELIKSNYLIKLLIGLINLCKDLIEKKLSLKVNWAKFGRIN